LIWFSFWYFW